MVVKTSFEAQVIDGCRNHHLVTCRDNRQVGLQLSTKSVGCQQQTTGMKAPSETGMDNYPCYLFFKGADL